MPQSGSQRSNIFGRTIVKFSEEYEANYNNGKIIKPTEIIQKRKGKDQKCQNVE